MNSMLQRTLPLAQWLQDVRRDLHRHPELSDAEFRTTSRIQTWLAEAGIPMLDLGLKTGVVAEVTGDPEGPIVALRADIDALPIEEADNPVSRAGHGSREPGKMHACGHDFHTAVLLGAARLLSELRPQLPGRVRLLFQPAEEAGTGAAAMLRAGALAAPETRMIFGFHNFPELPVGRVGVSAGPLMAAADALDITLTGKGGHGALPHLTADPIIAAGAVITCLQTLISRRTDPLAAAVVSLGIVHGGTERNVIPQEVLLQGTIRSYDPGVRLHLLRELPALVTSVSAGYGVEARVQVTPEVPAVVNDPSAAAIVAEAVRAVLGPDQVVPARRLMAGEDFALYLQQVSGCMIWVGTGNPEAGIVHAWHHPAFDVDESALPGTAAVLAQAAYQALHQLTEGGLPREEDPH